jgi:hypothetical protein
MTAPAAEARVRRLVEAARRIADPEDPLGQEARRVLPAATGLSPQGIELALEECLETHPSPAELKALCASVPSVPHAHVVTSANVFVGALRAIALGLAASERVSVRPSRRDPEMTRLLATAEPSLFRVVPRIEPEPGDHVWAYGSDETLATLRSELPAGCVLHAHGTGLGIVVLGPEPRSATELEDLGHSVAADVVPFDQRGCLSPRLVLALGSEADTRAFGEALARALASFEARVPRGRLQPEEAAEAVRYRDTLCFAAELVVAGSGLVGIDVRGGALVVPPPGRHVHVVRVQELTAAAAQLAGRVTSVAVDGARELAGVVRLAFPGARITVPGRMQRPPFDGPVDLRGSTGRARERAALGCDPSRVVVTS